MSEPSLPGVSILMPVRNEERYLPAAIASLQRQTFSDWELLAVDDGSSDATAAILAAAVTDPRIIVLQNPAKGLVGALNHGLAACRAALVARMDADDICHPDRLAEQVAILGEREEIGLVACSFRHFPRQELRSGMLGYEAWQNSLVTHAAIMADLFVESPFVHPGVMFRKALVTAVGGYRQMGWAEDYDLWLRLAASGVLFARTGRPLFFWRDRPERATRTMAEYSLEAFRACKLHHLQAGFLAGVERVILAGAGKEGRSWRRLLAAAGIEVSTWVDVDPRKIGRLLHGVRVVSPEEVSPLNGKMLVTVGTRGARAGIRHWADSAGFADGIDYLCVT